MKKNPDGTASIMTPPEYAEFDRNDWSTTDAELAKAMREKAKERPELGIFETTKE
jgi:hypothetical protein